MPLYTSLHNLLNELVQIANEMGLQKNGQEARVKASKQTLWQGNYMLERSQLHNRKT
jgi:hypothetical protein